MKEPSIRFPEQVEAGATPSGKLGSELQLPAQGIQLSELMPEGRERRRKKPESVEKSDSRAPEVTAGPPERELETTSSNIELSGFQSRVPCTSSINLTWELVKNANFQASLSETQKF